MDAFISDGWMVGWMVKWAAQRHVYGMPVGGRFFLPSFLFSFFSSNCC